MQYSNLIQNIRRYAELDEKKIPANEKYIKSVSVKKNEFLLKEGQVCRSLYFVEKGCLRMFFINNKSAEQIAQFALENWWMSDYNSFMYKKPTDYFIQAIESSEKLVN